MFTTQDEREWENEDMGEISTSLSYNYLKLKLIISMIERINNIVSYFQIIIFQASGVKYWEFHWFPHTNQKKNSIILPFPISFHSLACSGDDVILPLHIPHVTISPIR